MLANGLSSMSRGKSNSSITLSTSSTIWYDGTGWYAVGQLKGGTAFIGGYSTSECAYMAAIYAKFYELRGVQPTPHDEHHIAVYHTSRMQ